MDTTDRKVLNSFLHSPKFVELISLSLSPLLSPVAGEGDIAVNINFNIWQSLMDFVFAVAHFSLVLTDIAQIQLLHLLSQKRL